MLKQNTAKNIKSLSRKELIAEYLDYSSKTRGKVSAIKFADRLFTQKKITAEEYKNICVDENVDVASIETLAVTDVAKRGKVVPMAAADKNRVGEYRLLQPIGAGAMGEIILAHDTSLARTVVYKTLKDKINKDKRHRRRFLMEAQITAQLEHPSIIPVYNLLTETSKLAYTMKLVRGKTLHEYIIETQQQYKKRGEVDEQHHLYARLEHFLKVCDAVHYAHRKGVLHRDLKPQNVMIGNYNEVYVMDWGIAKILKNDPVRDDKTRAAVVNPIKNEKWQEDDMKTTVGRVVGTPAYMSPEQARAMHDRLDARSDLYSLGLILHEIVTLFRAIRGSNADDVLAKARAGKIDPVKKYSKQADIQKPLFAIIAKATQNNRDARYNSVLEFRDDIRRFMHGQRVHAYKEDFLQRTLRWVTRHGRSTLYLLLGSMMAVVVLVFLVIFGGLVSG